MSKLDSILNGKLFKVQYHEPVKKDIKDMVITLAETHMQDGESINFASFVAEIRNL